MFSKRDFWSLESQCKQRLQKQIWGNPGLLSLMLGRLVFLASVSLSVKGEGRTRGPLRSLLARTSLIYVLQFEKKKNVRVNFTSKSVKVAFLVI